MPSKTPKQARLMAACSHGADYEKCPPESVAKEFNQADKGTGVIRRRHGLTHFPHKTHSRNGR
jgi:hypothetical protein